ncbi:MAG: class I SAM-dependent methyltransferase [Polyangia bacterium]|jgi:SAM-dependent methyltransferase
MSDGSSHVSPELPASVRERTLLRFASHRRAWATNPALRLCYRDWYGLIRDNLPAPDQGPWVEIGSGPGFARELIPELMLTDIVAAPWHDRQVQAEALPFPAGSLGALVLFDVLHHLAAPPLFFAEAIRVLRPGGRIVLVEPYLSPVSHFIYRRYHEEPADLAVDPLAPARPSAEGKDPFLANQAIPTVLFCRGQRFALAFPELRVIRLRRLAGLAYPATGGLGRGPLLPLALWRAVYFAEGLMPEVAFRLLGFRMLVVIERR